MAPRPSVVAAMALLAAGCNWYYDKLPSPDDLMKAIPWFDHMITSPAVHPYKGVRLAGGKEVPRYTVKGTVPITGSEGDWGTGDPLKLQYAFDTLAANRLANPTTASGTIAAGDTAYHTFCAVCHGPSGAGDGPVGPRLGAPSLLTAKARTYSDGYIYSLIRYGRGVMPLYGDKVWRPRDRWSVVNYLRKLQADASPPPPGGGSTPR